MKLHPLKALVAFASILLLVTTAATAEGPAVTAAAAAFTPTLDGDPAEWQGVSPTKVTIDITKPGDAKNYTGKIVVELRAVLKGDMIYFLAQWPDDTKDVTHKSLVWNAELEEYEGGKDREDRLALRFDMGEGFSACMLSGTEYKADIWHWKSYRSQSVGLAHDKMHIYSKAKLDKAREFPSKDGGTIWVARPSDSGGKIYKSQRPLDHIGDMVPKYLPVKGATGSVADVKAGASWSNNMWTLEMGRKLNTGNADDVVFELGKSYNSSVATFNHTGSDHHSAGGFTLNIAK